MIIGFTGTRKGMTIHQKKELRAVFDRAEAVASFHHGCCHGADTDAHIVAKERGIHITGHPAGPSDLECDVMLDPRLPLARNRDIVDASDVMIVAPRSFKEERRSGTWATYRYANRIEKPLVILWHDGTRTLNDGFAGLGL